MIPSNNTITYKMVFDSTSNGIIVTDADGIISLINQEPVNLTDNSGEGIVVETFSPSTLENIPDPDKITFTKEEIQMLRGRDIVSKNLKLKFLPLKGNEALYKHYKLLNDNGQIITHKPAELRVKKWWYTLNTYANYNVAMRYSGQGTYRMFIVDPSSNVNPNLEFVPKNDTFAKSVERITDEDVKQQMKFCKKR